MFGGLIKWGVIAMTVGGLSAPGFASPGDPPAYRTAFENAFMPGFTVEINEAKTGEPPQFVKLPFRVLELGAVKIVSGRIAACDPFVNIGDVKPFQQAVPNGDHRVRLAIINSGIDRGRIEFARVEFSPKPAVTWKMALVEGQDLATLKAGEAFGYGVDAGTGSFYDPVAGEAANRQRKADENAWQQWQTDGEKNGTAAHLEPNFFLMQPMPPANIAMFVSGWGDGFYTSWFGYDADGQVAALVTDFGITVWDDVKK